jgi:hypothetical protein
VVLIRHYSEILDYLNLGEVRLYDSAGALIPSDSLTPALSSTFENSPVFNCFDGRCPHALAVSCIVQLPAAAAAGTRGRSSQPGGRHGDRLCRRRRQHLLLDRCLG